MNTQTEPTMKIKEFSKRLNVDPKTVRAWQEKGYIPDRRDASGYRYFVEDDYKTIKRLRRKNSIIYPETIRG